MTMRILTVRQPWASLLVLGIKPIENRSHGSLFRGDLAILAAQTVDMSPRAREAFDRHMDEAVYPVISGLPRGGVIGAVELYDVVSEHPPSWWWTGPFGLLVRNARRTRETIPMRGALYTITPDEVTESRIRRSLEGEKS